MIQFKYYKAGAQFDSSSLSPEDIAFVESTSSLYTHDKQYKFVTDAIETSIDSAISASNSAYSAADIAISAANRVDSAITQAERVNAELSGSVVSITNNSGETTSIDLLSTEYTTIKLWLKSDVSGVSEVGKTITLTVDGTSTTYTTDNNGGVTMLVLAGKEYTIQVEQVNGCETIEAVTGVADIVWRGYTVTYRQRYEQLIVEVKKNNRGTVTNYEGCTVTVAITNGNTLTLTTDNSGVATANILYGSTYTVTFGNTVFYYVRGGKTRTYTAKAPTRQLEVQYVYFNIGLYYVLSDGTEIDRDAMQQAIEEGTKNPEDAAFILLRTSELANYDGCFAFEIDAMINRRYGQTEWGLSGTLITTIPTNGNELSSQFYYDGLGACKAIKDWAIDNNKSKDDLLCYRTLNENHEIGGVIHEQFIGSVGQWSVLWGNRFEVDDMLRMVRPNAVNTFSAFTNNKWTSTQYSADYAWYWSNIANGNYGSGSYKHNFYTVVPFFAF